MSRIRAELDIDFAWMDRARCKGLDVDMFFPDRGESTAQVKAICAECPVREECLDFALLTSEAHGIWGGLSERQRRRLRRSRRLAA